MTEGKESSVLFSLRELMDLEHQRVDEENASRRRKADLEAEAFLEGERRAREEILARRLAEEEAARVDAARAREETAHLSAIREAALERVRREAQATRELEAIRDQQAHERALRSASADTQRRRLTTLAAGLGAALVATLAFGGVYLRGAPPAGAPAPGIVESREALKSLEAQLRAQHDQVAQLEQAAREAREARERVATRPVPTPPAPEHAVPLRAGSAPASAHVGKVAAPKPPTCIHDFDPMCGALP